MNFGNTFTDRIKIQKRLINVETTTLRGRAAELDTAIFGKHAERMIIGLRGISDTAQLMVAHSRELATEQSIIVAPTAHANLHKSALLGAINQAGGYDAPPVFPHTMMQTIANAAALGQQTPATTLTSSSTPKQCPDYGLPVASSDHFCGACGAVLPDAIA